MKNPLDISVIIPFKNHSDLTIPCIESLYNLPLREILLISNNSSDKELSLVYRAAKEHTNVKILIYNKEFNYQKINNWAIRQSRGKVLWLLNNDVELPAKSCSLVSTMYKKSLESSVGAVGAVLTYENGKTIQHAGIYLVPGATADHLYAGESLANVERSIKNGKYPYDTTKNLNLSAVTAASLMVERFKFNEIGGFNEAFIVAGGDVDLCLRLSDNGYRSVLIGSHRGTMIHKESRTRSLIGIPYSDFYESYRSYIKHFDVKTGDKFVQLENKT